MNAWLTHVTSLLAPLSSLSPPYPPPLVAPLKDYLGSPDQAANVRRNYDALQDLFHERAAVEIGASIGTPVDYCQWLFRRLMSTAVTPTVKLRLLGQLERLLAVQDSKVLDAFAQVVLVNLIPLLEAPQPAVFLEAATAVMAVLAERVPDRFSPYLPDYADILLGWRLQPSLAPSLRRALDALMRGTLAPLWRTHTSLTVELLTKLTDDLSHPAGLPTAVLPLLASGVALATALAPRLPALTLTLRLFTAACTHMTSQVLVVSEALIAMDAYDDLARLAALLPLADRAPLVRLLAVSHLRAPIHSPPLTPGIVCATLDALTKHVALLDLSLITDQWHTAASPLALLRMHSDLSVLRALALLGNALVQHHASFLASLIASINATLAGVGTGTPPAPLSALLFEVLLACRALSGQPLALCVTRWLALITQASARTKLAPIASALIIVALPRIPALSALPLLVPFTSPSTPPALLSVALRTALSLSVHTAMPSALTATIRHVLFASEHASAHASVAALLIAGTQKQGRTDTDGEISATCATLLWHWAECAACDASLPHALAYHISPVCIVYEAPPPLLLPGTSNTNNYTNTHGDWLARLLAALPALVSSSRQGHSEALRFVEGLVPLSPVQADEWLAEAVASQVTAARLRTSLGGPAQTLEALEKAVVEQAKRVATQGGRCADRAPAILLALAERLERHMYVAAEGAVTAPPPSRLVQAFFRTNRKVCDDWMARLRPPLVPLARHAAPPYHLAAHSAERLSAVLAKAGKDASEATRVLYFLAEALLEAGEAQALTGLAHWAPVDGSGAWLFALADEAHGRWQQAAATLRNLLVSNSNANASVSVLASLLAGRVSAMHAALHEEASTMSQWSAEAAPMRPLPPIGPRAALLALAASTAMSPMSSTSMHDVTGLHRELHLLIRSRTPLSALMPALRLLASTSTSTAAQVTLTSVPTQTSTLLPPAEPLAWLALAPLVHRSLALGDDTRAPTLALQLARRHAHAGNVRAAQRWLGAVNARIINININTMYATDLACTAAVIEHASSGTVKAVAHLTECLPRLSEPHKAHMRLARWLAALHLDYDANAALLLPATATGLSLDRSAALLAPNASMFGATGAQLIAARDTATSDEARTKSQHQLALWAFAVPAFNLRHLLTATPSPLPDLSHTALCVLRKHAVDAMTALSCTGAVLEKDVVREGVEASEAKRVAYWWDTWRVPYVLAPFRLALTSCASVLQTSSASVTHWPLALRLLRLLQANDTSLHADFVMHTQALPAGVWLSLLPQLVAVLKHSGTSRDSVAPLVQHWLSRVAEHAPHLVLFPVLAAASSASAGAGAGTSAGTGSGAGGAPLLAPLEAQLRGVRGADVAEASAVRHELVHVAVLDEERWLLELARVHTLVSGGRMPARALAARLARLLELATAETTDVPLAPHARAFRQLLHPQLCRALEVLRTCEASGDEAWNLAGLKALQHTLLARVHAWAGRLPLASLSPRLAALRSTSLCFPTLQHALPDALQVASLGADVHLLPTKTRPKRISVIAVDGTSHAFLLKGRDELAIDQRILQFLHLSNLLFQASATTKHSAPPLHARTYAVTPLAPRVGLVEMVPRCVSLFAIYRHWRRRKAHQPSHHHGHGHHEPVRPAEDFHARIVPLLRERGVAAQARKEWPIDVLQRVFEELRAAVPSDLLARELHCAATSVRAAMSATHALARGSGTMSVLGYVAGLGDRHADNILVDLQAGALLHIDHNVCLDAGLRLRVPELVPFRLTHTMQRAMGVSGVHGVFTESACAALTMLRAERVSVALLFDTLRDEAHLDWGAARADAARAAAERAVSLGLVAARLADMHASITTTHTRLTHAITSASSVLNSCEPFYGPAAAQAHAIDLVARTEQACTERAATVGEALRRARQELQQLHVERAEVERDEAKCRSALVDAASKCAKWQERHEAAVARVRHASMAPQAIASERVRRALEAYEARVLSRVTPEWARHNRHAEWHAILTELVRAPSVALLDALQAQLTPAPTPLSQGSDEWSNEELRRDLVTARMRVADAWNAVAILGADQPQGVWALLTAQSLLTAVISTSTDDIYEALALAHLIALLLPCLEISSPALTALGRVGAALQGQAQELIGALAGETVRAVSSEDASVRAALTRLYALATAVRAGALAPDETERAWLALRSDSAAAGGALLLAAHATLLTRPEAYLPDSRAQALHLAPVRISVLASLLQCLSRVDVAPSVAAVRALLQPYHGALAGVVAHTVLAQARDAMAMQWIDDVAPDEQTRAEAFGGTASVYVEAMRDAGRAQARLESVEEERMEHERIAAIVPGAPRDALLALLNSAADEPEGKSLGLRALLDFEAHRFANEPRAANLDSANASLLLLYRRALLASSTVTHAIHTALARVASLEAELHDLAQQCMRMQSERQALAATNVAAHLQGALTALAAHATAVTENAALPIEADTLVQQLVALCHLVAHLTPLQVSASAVLARHSDVTARQRVLGAQLAALLRGEYAVSTLAQLVEALAGLSADIDALHAALATTMRLCVQHVGAGMPGGEHDAAADREEDLDENNVEEGGESDEDSEEALSGTAFSVADDGAGDEASIEHEKSRQEEVLQRVRDKLEGIDTVWCGSGVAQLSVRAQVSTLIGQATSASNLAAMYEGWAAWI